MAKILIVDDEESLRDVLTQMLRRSGHTIITASDGEQALGICKTGMPDLIITDIIMPNKDGIQFITEILKINKYTPIIAMSGGRRAVTAEFNLDSAELLGVRAVLAKPFTIEQLREALQKAGF